MNTNFVEILSDKNEAMTRPIQLKYSKDGYAKLNMVWIRKYWKYVEFPFKLHEALHVHTLKKKHFKWEMVLKIVRS